MFLSYIIIADLLIRFIAIGQLSLIAVVVCLKPLNFKSVLILALTLCLSGYLLLTTSVPDRHYGGLRGPLLLLTEMMPYFLWCLALAVFNDDFHPKYWPLCRSKALKLLLLGGLLWFSYFFAYQQGQGVFHQINHGIQALLVFHLVFEAVKGLRDDLVESRRKIRILCVAYFGLYMLVLVMIELIDNTIAGTATFSLINGALVLLSITVLSAVLFKPEPAEEVSQASVSDENDVEQPNVQNSIPLVYQQSFGELRQLMDEGYFKQTNLTIAQLADKLSMPEHQLRELINQHLGFRNFSAFLNSYRIPAACALFEDISQIRTPILTIALELGYGSVGPFNRSFKEIIGQTPSEYRKKFKNDEGFS